MICMTTKCGKIHCREYKSGIEVYEYKGTDFLVDLCELERTLNKPVISIAKKAFLSCKSVQTIILGEAVEEIGDWAFAFCSSLKEIHIPMKEIKFGKELFKECTSLHRIAVQEEHPDELLAAAVVKLKAPHLFHVQKKEENWYVQFDRVLLEFIEQDDRDGLVGSMVGGEEEYGTQEHDLQRFMHEKRMEKVRLAFLRLINPFCLNKDVKERLGNYLVGHTIGEQHSETWDVLLENRENISYIQIFLDTGCFHSENYNQILEKLGDSYSEMKAMFIKYKNSVLGYEDIFSLLTDF